jgi:3'(2'), 5'-bisphosphate nucleotidase
MISNVGVSIMGINLTVLQKPLIALVQQAGEAILEIYEKSRQYAVQIKADHSPVTQADLAANVILTAGLRALTPEYPVLSEEGISTPWSERQTWTHYWLIDPLDGTRQFIQHNGEFTVNVALIQNNQPIIGLLHVPVTGETYYASTAWGGAYKQDAHQQIRPLRVRLWRTDETIILTSRAARAARIHELFSHLGALTQIGMSSALKFGRLAEGKADLSPRLGDTSEWDTAAGQCILELAGGALVDLTGKPLRYNTRDIVLNPHFIAVGDADHLLKRLVGWAE